MYISVLGKNVRIQTSSAVYNQMFIRIAERMGILGVFYLPKVRMDNKRVGTRNLRTHSIIAHTVLFHT